MASVLFIICIAIYMNSFNQDMIIDDNNISTTIAEKIEDHPIDIEYKKKDLLESDENVEEKDKISNKDHIKQVYEDVNQNSKVKNNYKYKVKPGMTMYSIATMLYGDRKMINDIKKLNNISDSANIKLDKILLLPRRYSNQYKSVLPRVYKMKKGDTLFSISMRYHGNRNIIESIKKINGIEDIDNISTGRVIFIPVN